MEANLKTLLDNVRPEEVGLEPVTLYDGALVGHNASVPLSEPITDFEYLHVYAQFISGAITWGDVAEITPSELYTGSERRMLLSLTGSGTSSDLAVVYWVKGGSTTTSLLLSVGAGGSYTNVGVYKVVGYKRRYSKTSLAEITEAASKPNLFINTWHAGAKVVNQRGFDGNWSALAVGNYGLDMWLKTSATHKGFIVEAGSYKPSTKHTVVADDGAILGTVISPADGGHWLHAFPFASDKFSIREGDIPLGWSPDTDSRLDECLKHYERVYTYVQQYTPSSMHVCSLVNYYPKRLAVPRSTALSVGNYGNAISAYLEDVGRSSAKWIVQSQGAGAVYANGYLSEIDATIALSEVTDDAEHRVVWG